MAVTPFGRPDMLVGQPVKILIAYSTAIIQCQCEAKALIMLAALNRSVPCPACGRRFAIAESGIVKIGEVLHDPTTDGPVVPAGLVS